jgi:hypothetical protein
MEVIDNQQGKRKSQLKYSNVIVTLGVILFIVLVIILKIQQLLA